MKSKIKYFTTHPMILILVIILIFFTPLALFSPGENKERGIVIAVGIDKTTEYEVSLLTFIPTANQSYKEQTSLISGKGQSLGEAIYNAQIAMGRRIGLAHAKTTVVSESMLEDDICKSIDYISRIASLPENTVFISTDKNAKELLQANDSLVSKTGLKLEQVINYNAENLYISDTSLEAFYKGYFGRTHSSIIGSLKLKESPSSQGGNSSGESGAQGGGENSSGSSGSGAQASSSGNAKMEIENNGDAILLKNGKMVAKLDVDMLNGMNILNPRSKHQIINIEDIEKDDQLVNMGYRVADKKVIINTKFENGYPLFVAELILSVDLVEIEGVKEGLKVNTEFSNVTNEVATKIEHKVKQQFTKSLNLIRECKADVMGINDTFYRNNRKEYEKYIRDNGGVDEFLNNVIFKLNILVQPDWYNLVKFYYPS